MSSVTPVPAATSTGSGPSAVRPAQALGAPGRKGDPEQGGDVFAHLLMQVSDIQRTEDAPAAEAATSAPGLLMPADAALPAPAPTSTLLADLPGFPPDSPGPSGGAGAEAGPLQSLLEPGERAPAAGLERPPAPGGTALPPGMTATADAARLDADTATAPALAESTPALDAAGRPAPAAPFLGRKRDAANATAGASHLQGWQWRKTPAAVEARGLAGGGVVVGTPAPGAALPFQSLAQATAHRAGPRSTVALHDRFGTASGAGTLAAEAPAWGSTLGWVSALAPSIGQDARNAPATLAPGEAGSVTGATESADAVPADSLGSAADAAAQAAEDEARQISHWGTQTLRHASLRVGQAGEEAIDIRLSLAGQEVQVDFRTDSAEARASLQQHATESLAHLLQRSGIQLGGVSVGAQGQGSGPDPRGAERSRQPSRADGVVGPASVAEPARRPGMASPRADGSQPLDVFA